MPDSNGPTSPGAPRPPVDAQGAASPPPPPPGYPPMAYAPPPAQPSARSAVVSRVVTSLLGIIVVGSLLLNVYLGFAYSMMLNVGKYESNYAPGDENYRVAILPIEGMINAEMADFVRTALMKIEKNPPDALVIRVNSGGGGVTASDEIWHYITDYKTRHDLPVVASFGGVAASGGYYVATPADYIFAEQTCITGSIGVMAQIPTVGGMFDKIGVEMVEIEATKSSEKTVANSMYRDWDDQDRAVVRKLLDVAYERFVDVVEDGRNTAFRARQEPELTREEVVGLATGAVYSVHEAEKLRLVDKIGFLGEAIDKAGELAGVPAGVTPRATILSQPKSLMDSVLGASLDAPAIELTPESVRTFAEELGTTRLMYRARFN